MCGAENPGDGPWTWSFWNHRGVSVRPQMSNCRNKLWNRWWEKVTAGLGRLTTLSLLPNECRGSHLFRKDLQWQQKEWWGRWVWRARLAASSEEEWRWPVWGLWRRPRWSAEAFLGQWGESPGGSAKNCYLHPQWDRNPLRCMQQRNDISTFALKNNNPFWVECERSITEGRVDARSPEVFAQWCG